MMILMTNDHSQLTVCLQLYSLYTHCLCTTNSAHLPVCQCVLVGVFAGITNRAQAETWHLLALSPWTSNTVQVWLLRCLLASYMHTATKVKRT